MAESITQQLETLVAAQWDEWELYAIDSYGWIDHETVDQEYVGYAQWQLSAPDPLDYQSTTPGPIDRRPTDAERDIRIYGEDFVGLMQTGRLAIGLAAVFAHHLGPLSPDGPFGNSLFALHHAHAMVALGAAADRLRACFIAGVLHKSQKDYDERATWYINPFDDAAKVLAGVSNANELLALNDRLRGIIRNVIVDLRRQRNRIVHDTTTAWARALGNLLADLQGEYDAGPCKICPPTEWDSCTASDESDDLTGLGDSLQLIKAVVRGYRTLIDAGNLVFQLENARRIRSRA